MVPMTLSLRAPSPIVLRAWERVGPETAVPNRSAPRAAPAPVARHDPEAPDNRGAGRPGPAERSTAIATALAALHRKDAATLHHAVATATLAMALAAALGRSEREQLHAYDAGLVHDLGKLFVPRRLLRHEGRLDPRQRAVFQDHAALGAELARKTPGLARFVVAIAHHHERWDGAGYPDGLAEEAIPWDARVVAVADVAAVMRAGRPYRAPRSVTDVATELERCAGGQFCPATVEAALDAPRFGATLATAVRG